MTPVVFIHGLIGTFQVPPLTDQFSAGAIAPDLLGYGSAADVPESEVDLHNQVAHLQKAVTSVFGSSAVHIVGHSVGGAVAALFAHAFPDRVASFVSVEGNFTLDDAFWCAKIARMSEAEAEQMLAGFQANPAEWLARSGIPATPRFLDVARHWLDNQPASTLRAMARSVVDVTGRPEYLRNLRSVFSRCTVHLVAGERSREGWQIPDWALDESSSLTVLAGTGHMMMLENTRGFVAILRRLLDQPTAE